MNYFTRNLTGATDGGVKLHNRPNVMVTFDLNLDLSTYTEWSYCDAMTLAIDLWPSFCTYW